MIDIVIPYTEGETKGAELKLCLEGIKRHMVNHRNVYIIGDRPSFEGDYIHVQETDRGRGKQDNIRIKILTGCELPKISDPFLFMNDDYFLIRQMDASAIPYCYNKNMFQAWNDKRKVGSYKQALHNTVELLGPHALHYDIHYPILYDKSAFKYSMQAGNWEDWSKRDGYVIKSIYCNISKVEGVQMDDPKLKDFLLTPEEVHGVVKGWPMFSTDENSFNQAVIDYLASINICV
jgi:hypothetical protein